ncbi:unnamed protein product [Polarella glacialis]|uniref:Uncharacterized protein n=1 Tax=Polarella glacialis TaxID=89957 RepID=A0A813LAC6_POLGL|nr:unnamed protein product [Polarella glacialis]CAE8681200.1 unnamed protein product [Polarella glacialis]CAE8722685.1 unnamed protein product [Polarella glacialis]|eukprot:CAMPEP_0115077228 /NCGR_PEP_ID=MMETSP0227-20121206/16872_1 /TAXON_ID=89957 /ORGANISM="Polarella glacialis, Strain CCMP 1383" /LENGTH=130 /DNA_ID=CAMNT_0002464469 /DNA_START=80 /DNA_END=472 /DNA_ORIENTATION=-
MGLCSSKKATAATAPKIPSATVLPGMQGGAEVKPATPTESAAPVEATWTQAAPAGTSEPAESQVVEAEAADAQKMDAEQKEVAELKQDEVKKQVEPETEVEEPQQAQPADLLQLVVQEVPARSSSCWCSL